jgi:hypothetical protein
MGVCGQLHAPAALSPGKRPGTHYIGGWVYSSYMEAVSIRHMQVPHAAVTWDIVNVGYYDFDYQITQ